MDVSGVIGMWGGRAAIAAFLGITKQATYAWSRKKRVPFEYHAALIGGAPADRKDELRKMLGSPTCPTCGRCW